MPINVSHLFQNQVFIEARKLNDRQASPRLGSKPPSKGPSTALPTACSGTGHRTTSHRGSSSWDNVSSCCDLVTCQSQHCLSITAFRAPKCRFIRQGSIFPPSSRQWWSWDRRPDREWSSPENGTTVHHHEPAFGFSTFIFLPAFGALGWVHN